MMKTLQIGQHKIGSGHPALVIAEAGVNHNGSVACALELIDAAADAGCDAVKFQKRNIRAMLSRAAFDRPYSNNGHSHGRTYGEHREHVELSEDDYLALYAHAQSRGILFMASAWDHESATFLDSLGVVAHKIGSPDLTNLSLCRHIAAMGKPVILSTGMSESWEVDAVVRSMLAVNPALVLMHCMSIYPTPYDQVRLGCMATLRDTYGLHVGYSGHEAGWHVVLGAVALGARVIEKHITLDRSMKGGDHAFSLEPAELGQMICEIRDLEAALSGRGTQLSSAEVPFRNKLGKSVATRFAIEKGTILTADMLTCKCPATGISPLVHDDLIGKCVTRDIGANEVLVDSDVDYGIKMAGVGSGGGK